MSQDELVTNFQDTFSKQQKAAIVTALTCVSTSKGEPHPKDIECLIQMALVLGIELNDSAITVMQEKSEQQLVDTLNTLDEGQKDWFIVALHSMASADGKVEFCEMAVAIDICNRIGISDDRYGETIEKTKAIMKKF